MFDLDEIYSVSSFLSLCNKTVENNIPTCWLQGEISNLARPASGHWYFSLKDNRGQVRCALFRLNQRNIKFTPENGMEVLVRAAPTLYEARGDFQLIIQHIEPIGAGNLNLAFEQLKSQLSKEGLFDSIHKKPLPEIVNTIGVISSSTGAVIQDIIRVLHKRYPFSEILLFDSVVQGEGSEIKLAQAIEAADQSNRCDVLILARGGGSLEDLWAFNEESLARVIFTTNTPIISAIGHETDTTIADFVADVRAPTPSAAAMLATPDRLEILSSLDKLTALLQQHTRQYQQHQQAQLDLLKLRIPTPDKTINYLSQQLDYLSHRLTTSAISRVSNDESRLSTLYATLKQHSPKEHIRHSIELNKLSVHQLNQQINKIINDNTNILDSLKNRLNNSSVLMVDRYKNALSIHANTLNLLSPLSTLSRGYSITTNVENQVLSSIENIDKNQMISTRLSSGIIHSKVVKIEKN
ncbi:exodeoxyribonuclease VII large subunit [Candidatus Thioglobus sp.]|jgi:exodeoxyribonuclease VII large subunit|uniref:exodeoxyribonuclease VII large subunit n=1 Tax=Candidatus Thioglobus sp. TaxID=2026721 RepID=UPI00176EA10A|nr:exodeoxyribonuclease VII large subunit [Candidatus Thioglobus sp.]HIF47547.1 exodeoxyribonuclease VII large subunit [Candidatus Thioglobus sp.]HIL04207.1 exodeoxyribonuclease VII large subunit [Candidatus Thioglobus autotrophicus]